MTGRVQEHAGGGLLVARDGPVAAITFNNPDRLNAMRLGMWEALGDTAEALADDDDLRVVTLRGAGTRAFVSGADISEFAENRSGTSVSGRYNAMVARAEVALEALPVPTLALIRGYCVGGGLGIAMRCDLRLAAEDARFAITPARLGLGYGFDAVGALHRRLGPSTTADLLFTARKMPAGEALRKGICDRLFATDVFDAQTDEIVQGIAANAPLTIRAVKASLRALAGPEGARDRARIDAMVAACFDSADYREGQAAFAEKRAPRFRGL